MNSARLSGAALVLLMAVCLVAGLAEANFGGFAGDGDQLAEMRYSHQVRPRKNLFCGLPCCILPIGLLGVVLWIWAIIDCATNEPSEGNDKIIWILVIVLANWIGALIYLLVRRPQRKREIGR